MAESDSSVNPVVAKDVPNLNGIEQQAFWSFVDTSYKGSTGTCWGWCGALVKGYGVFRNFKATRIMWRLHHGQSPPHNLFVCHHCDDPKCVNPTHLFLGTNQDNQLDASVKGRLHGLKGELNPSCKLTDVQCNTIREIWQTGIYTQAAIAHQIGTSQSQVSRIVLGLQRGFEPIETRHPLYDFGRGPERICDAAKTFGISQNTINQRLNRGYCPPCAATLAAGQSCPHRSNK